MSRDSRVWPKGASKWSGGITEKYANRYFKRIIRSIITHHEMLGI